MQTPTTQNTKELWDSCLIQIQNEVSPANFSTWFKNTYITKEDNGHIFIAVPNEFVKDWLSNKYNKLIMKVLQRLFNEIRAVEFVISKQTHGNQSMQQNTKEQVGGGHQTLPLKNLYINKEDNLNPRYNFDTFVVGSFNELAYAAAQAIINKPGRAYNPFFIYGSTGLGKTHLIQAVGNALKTQNNNIKVFYTTLEKFAIDYVNSLGTNSTNQFKEKYRKYDVLIMDDIQFISGKEKTQEELFHLFNTLYDSNKQIVFSSDKHPNKINGIHDRLRTRCSAGMIVDISEPDYETRLAILKSKINDENITIPEDTLSMLAQTIDGSIRELEGSLNAVLCQTQLKGKNLSIQEIKRLIKDNTKPKKHVSVKEVAKIVSDFYNLEENMIYEKSRRREIVRARQVAMYILREDFSVSYPHIGQKLGGKDHTTVIHSCIKIKEESKKDPVLEGELEQIRLMFK